MSCYNVEKLIEWQIASLAGLEYPRDKLEVIFIGGVPIFDCYLGAQSVVDVVMQHTGLNKEN